MRWEGEILVDRFGAPDPAAKDAPESSLTLQISSDAAADLQMPLSLRQAAFVKPQLVPLWSIQGPELAVYSRDAAAHEFFGKLAAQGLGVLAHASGSGAKTEFDHILIYFSMDIPARVCARILRLKAPAAEQTLAVERQESSPPVQAPIVPLQCGIDGPRKALQQTVLAALRIRGVDRSHRDYKLLYQETLRAAEVSLRNIPQPISLDLMREKVEALLTVFS